jgi:hypothetical protein
MWVTDVRCMITRPAPERDAPEARRMTDILPNADPLGGRISACSASICILLMGGQSARAGTSLEPKFTACSVACRPPGIRGPL